MTQKRDRPADEIVVTERMRRAGAAAFEEFSESYDEKMLAEAIYIAMARVSRERTHGEP